MAWSTTVVDSTVTGNTRIYSGTYTNTAGTTGGTVALLGHIINFNVVSDTCEASMAASKSGGTLTITTTALDTGEWTVQGYGGG